MAWGDDDAADRERCAKENIHYCEPGNPYPPDGTRRAYHPMATEVDDSQRDGWPSGDTVQYRCPVCGAEWRTELPQ